jgi:hypothetical protein
MINVVPSFCKIALVIGFAGFAPAVSAKLNVSAAIVAFFLSIIFGALD